ncbi:MAG TPA: leucine-rich repeat domain-containing protein [Phycisphaerae bacterium]|nr:leucine-rich repeat domain-containing protein [Phycisphaerae bacterium]HRW54862.1 leucine-rich repeat domain-containing protein [Phycisphaerae bacterium]
MVGNDGEPQHQYAIDPATMAAYGRVTRWGHCACLFARTKKGNLQVPNFHLETQDQTAPGWRAITRLIEQSAHARAGILEPSSRIPWEDWIGVITLPMTIASLEKVKQIRLYGSHLRRIPPDIGRMNALQSLDLYRSYLLHWLPYEVLRCRRLTESRMSVRALYGNRKTRLPFPRLSNPIELLLPSTCSVCDRSFDERAPRLHWTTQRVATDTVPLLVHTCSKACVDSVPSAPKGCFERPHRGGGGVGMPAPRR